MKKIKLRNINYNIVFLSIIICLGIYLSFIGGYGSDEDTLPLIGAFESMLGGERVMASRFTPYPVAELGIGFLSYYLGSWAANLSTFLFIIFGCVFFYIGVSSKVDFEKLTFFLILCLSNPTIFFDNIEPIDYSWAFIFFSLGIFFLKKKYFELSVIFFGICIGTRINFILFIFFVIFFFDFKNQINLSRKIITFLGSFFVGGLFYLTIWYQHGFGIEWLTAVTPNNQGVFGLLSRFIYKTFLSITFLSFIFIFFIFLKKFFNKNFKKFLIFENNLLIFLVIISNLILFFIIPAEISYLQPFLISLYFFFIKKLNKNIIITLILLNLSSWIIDFKFLKIQYKSEDKCENVEAVSAKFNFHFKEGKFKEYLVTRNKIRCWVKDDSERSIKIIKGKALKN